MIPLMLFTWSQVFTFPAGAVQRLAVTWTVGKVRVEHREDSLFRVEIRKPDTLPGQVILGEDTLAYEVRLEEDTLRVRMEDADRGYRRHAGFLEGLRIAFAWLGWIFGKTSRSTIEETDSVEVIITGPPRPYTLTLRVGDAVLRMPSSGEVTVNMGDLEVEGGDTARLTAVVNMGDVNVSTLQHLTLELNMGDAELVAIQQAQVSLNMGDLTATRVQEISFSVNMGDVRIREGGTVRGSVDMGDVEVVGTPEDRVQVTTRMGEIHVNQEEQP